jgi:hypothetical protein
MQEYGQFCPVALGAEIFAERWTPLILRELLQGSHRFSELRKGLPRISRNLLVHGSRGARTGLRRWLGISPFAQAVPRRAGLAAAR